MIYFAAGLFFSFLAIIEAITKDEKFSFRSALLFLFFMLLMVSLRHEVGTDWFGYYYFYENEAPKSIEVGYRLLNNTLSNIGVPYNIFLFIINTISLVSLFYFIRSNVSLLILAILIYFSDLFLYLNFSGIRQAIAISLTCLSVNYVINRDFLKFATVILIASSFHLTAISFIVTYFIPNKKLKKRVLFKIIILLLILIFSYNYIINLIISTGLKNAEYYIILQQKSSNIEDLFLVGLIKRLVPLLLVAIFVRKYFQIKNAYFYLHTYLLGFLIYVLTYKISPDIGVRLSSFFTIIEIVIICNILYKLKNLTNRLVVTLLVVTISIYKLNGYSNSEVYQYNNILSVLLF